MGIALYSIYSMANHACRPAASYSFLPQRSGPVLSLRVLRPVAVGEELTVCYTDPLGSRSAARQHLAHTYCFACDCGRCSQEEVADCDPEPPEGKLARGPLEGGPQAEAADAAEEVVEAAREKLLVEGESAACLAVLRPLLLALSSSISPQPLHVAIEALCLAIPACSLGARVLSPGAAARPLAAAAAMYAVVRAVLADCAVDEGELGAMQSCGRFWLEAGERLIRAANIIDFGATDNGATGEENGISDSSSSVLADARLWLASVAPSERLPQLRELAREGPPGLSAFSSRSSPGVRDAALACLGRAEQLLGLACGREHPLAAHAVSLARGLGPDVAKIM